MDDYERKQAIRRAADAAADRLGDTHGALCHGARECAHALGDAREALRSLREVGGLIGDDDGGAIATSHGDARDAVRAIVEAIEPARAAVEEVAQSIESAIVLAEALAAAARRGDGPAR